MCHPKHYYIGICFQTQRKYGIQQSTRHLKTEGKAMLTMVLTIPLSIVAHKMQCEVIFLRAFSSKVLLIHLIFELFIPGSSACSHKFDHFHRIIEQFELEGAFKSQLDQTPAMSRDNLDWTKLLRDLLCLLRPIEISLTVPTFFLTVLHISGWQKQKSVKHLMTIH